MEQTNLNRLELALMNRADYESFFVMNQVPYIRYFDMIAFLTERQPGKGTQKIITDRNLKELGISFEEGVQLASTNQMDFSVMSMQVGNNIHTPFSVVCPENIGLYAIALGAVDEKQTGAAGGAAILFRPDLLDKIPDIIDSEKFLILPSSRFDVICLDLSHMDVSDMELERLAEIVRQVNCKINPDFRLSNSIYSYDQDKKEVSLVYKGPESVFSLEAIKQELDTEEYQISDEDEYEKE